MGEEILVPNQIMTKKLLILLRKALWVGNSNVELSATEFSSILKLAEEQTVFGLVFDVLKDMSFDGMSNRMPIYEAIGQSELIKQQNGRVNKELSSFVYECDRTGLNYFVVKGQVIACLYPHPELRQPGDIDFLINQILQIFPDVAFPQYFPEKEFAFNHNGITYELHTRLVDFGCKKHRVLWEDIIAKEWSQYFYVDIDDVKVRTLSPTVNAIYLFLHLFFHLIREGVSLRQFCDWAVFLHHYRNTIDKQQLTEIIQALDMQNAYKAFGCVLVDELGLPEDEFPMLITDENRRWKERILDDVFSGGNFGKQNHHAKTSIGFKFETLQLAIRNCIRYHKLAPSEMRMMIPKMIGINLKLMNS